MATLDFNWVAKVAPRFLAVAHEYKFDWTCVLGDPAGSEACDAAERQLGVRLPPSLRAFYLCHDGARIAMFRVHSLRELIEDTKRARVDDLSVYDERVDDLLSVVDLGDGNRYVLDSSNPDADGEHPVLDAFHEVGPSEWRDTIVASSFGDWLHGVFSDVIEHRRDPFSQAPLDEATISSEYLLESAIALAHQGETDEARTRLLRAIAWIGMDDASAQDELGFFERAIEQLHVLGEEHEGDTFLLGLFRKVLKAERLCAMRGERFGMSIYCGDRVYPPEDFERRYGLKIPPQLAGVMRTYGSITIFMRHAYPPPLPPYGAGLTIFGGAYSYLRPANPEIDGAAPDSLVIASVGGGGAGYPYDLFLSDPTGRIWRVGYRPPSDYSWIPSGGVIPFKIIQAGPPILAAPSLDDFIETAFEKHADGAAPYDLSAPNIANGMYWPPA